ncbi:MAG: LysM peptidoglycan-binding domain-containing protein [Aggregatilineales bacterium]
MRKWLLLLTLIFIGAVGITATQAQDENCVPVVEQTLAALSEMCTEMGRNSACYGANNIESETTLDPRPDDYFVAPGDRAELIELLEIRPLPLDTEDETFGAGLLNVQADIPDSVPGQAVIFLLMGDARLTNEPALNDGSDAAPFQSFYFLPGAAGNTNCYEADPILTIQTPGNIAINIVLNGVETEMSPGTLLTITDSVCTIHRGNIRQGEVALLANQTVDIFIDEEGAVNVTGLRGISEREYQRGLLVQESLNALARENGSQEFFLSEVTEFAEEPPSQDEACATQHTIRGGDTLHYIAQQYAASVQEIADFNGLDNPRQIRVGQVLCIPGAGEGFVPLSG